MLGLLSSFENDIEKLSKRTKLNAAAPASILTSLTWFELIVSREILGCNRN